MYVYTENFIYYCLKAVCLGASVFGEEGAELKLEDIQVTDFGEVGELSVSKDDCLMLYGKGILS